MIVPPVPPAHVDPVCAFHGRRWSEHPDGRCLYCALCFTTLSFEECHELPDGSREDVCEDCAALEAAELKRRAAWGAL